MPVQARGVGPRRSDLGAMLLLCGNLSLSSGGRCLSWRGRSFGFPPTVGGAPWNHMGHMTLREGYGENSVL